MGGGFYKHGGKRKTRALAHRSSPTELGFLRFPIKNRDKKGNSNSAHGQIWEFEILPFVEVYIIYGQRHNARMLKVGG